MALPTLALTPALGLEGRARGASCQEVAQMRARALGRITLTALLAVGFLLAGVGPSEAGSVDIGQPCIWNGTLACKASGIVHHPMGLFLSGQSTYQRRIPVDWTTRCWKEGERRRREGHFKRRAPFRKDIRMGYRRPDRCRVRVSIQTSHLGRHGRVFMLARV